MPHLFQPYADTVARTVLLAVLVGPFVAIGVAYWISDSEYTTDQSLTLEPASRWPARTRLPLLPHRS